MTRPLGPVLRIVFAAAGLAMMVPAKAFEGAIWTDVIGFVVGTILIISQLAIGARLRRAVDRPT